MSFTWKGINSDSMDIIVENVQRVLLPPISNTLIEINQKPGALLQRDRIGVREISITIRIRDNEPTAYEQHKRELAAWLYSDKAERLMIDPLYYYMAKLDGTTEVEKITFTKGKVQLRFIIPDPFAWGAIDYTRYIPAGTGVTSWNVDGTYKTFPVIRATFKKPTPFFMYAGNGSDRDQVIYGEPESDTKPAAALPLRQVMLSENFGDISDWQAGNIVENGEVQGTMEASNAGSGTTTYGTFGVAPSATRQWYGPAIKRALPEPLENWEVEFIVNFLNNDAKKMTRAEIYLLDVNGGIIGRLSLYDRFTSVSDTEVKISIGGASNRTDVLNSNGGKRGTYNKFYGMVKLRKNGNNYEAYVGVYSTATQKYHTQLTKRFYDTSGRYKNLRLAQVELHIGAFGAAEILPKANVYADNLTVYRRNVPEEETEVPNIINTGEVLEFDHQTKQITLDGVPYKRHLNPLSHMFALEPGSNTIAFDPPDVADVQVLYKSRWI